MRTIKKYQNRRLYDTRQSSYITLENIREMIISGENFCVVDAKNASDVTHHVLLQIIGERETQTGTSMLSNELLANLIRFYGDSLQGVLGEYLEDSVSKFVERQTQLRSQMHSVLDPPRATSAASSSTVSRGIAASGSSSSGLASSGTASFGTASPGATSENMATESTTEEDLYPG